MLFNVDLAATSVEQGEMKLAIAGKEETLMGSLKRKRSGTVDLAIRQHCPLGESLRGHDLPRRS